MSDKERKDKTPHEMVRERVARAPSGTKIFRWLGPGLLWMVSAVGSGSVLFTPRVGARYQYALLWLVPLVSFLMWVMIREAGRYSVVTGETLLEGLHRLPGPRDWAVWLVFVPQLVAAVIGIAGLAALVGSAFKVAIAGDHTWWASGFLVLACGLVISGGYRRVEQAARVFAAVLLGIAIVAAIEVFPGMGTFGAGLVPGLPAQPDAYFIVPWVGTILAGSMGIVWFSYWAATRGYGGGVSALEADDAQPSEERKERLGARDREARLKKWLRVMSWTAALGVVTGTLVIVSFLVLGSELLAPQGLVPQGINVAHDLSRLLADLWGQWGYWLMIVAVVVAIGGSIFANQDGWGRSFADMTIILLRKRRHIHEEKGVDGWLKKLDALRDRLPFDPLHRRSLKIFYVAFITGLLPLVTVLVFRDPVRIMSASGIVAAVHTPFIVALTLIANRRLLPEGLRPGAFYMGTMIASSVFYAVLGVLELLQIAGVPLGQGSS